MVSLICEDSLVSSDSAHQFQLIFKLRALISKFRSSRANLAATNLPLEYPLNLFTQSVFTKLHNTLLANCWLCLSAWHAAVAAEYPLKPQQSAYGHSPFLYLILSVPPRNEGELVTNGWNNDELSTGWAEGLVPHITLHNLGLVIGYLRVRM